MIYEVIIGNFLDDTTLSKLILTRNEVAHKDLKLMLGIEDEFEYIMNIKKPDIFVSAWDEKDYYELNEIRNLLNH